MRACLKRNMNVCHDSDDFVSFREGSETERHLFVKTHRSSCLLSTSWPSKVPFRRFSAVVALYFVQNSCSRQDFVPFLRIGCFNNDNQPIGRFSLLYLVEPCLDAVPDCRFVSINILDKIWLNKIHLRRAREGLQHIPPSMCEELCSWIISCGILECLEGRAQRLVCNEWMRRWASLLLGGGRKTSSTPQIPEVNSWRGGVPGFWRAADPPNLQSGTRRIKSSVMFCVLTCNNGLSVGRHFRCEPSSRRMTRNNFPIKAHPLCCERPHV